eukprot:9516075-Alexandrium_andersonii.AAC.1
MRSLPRVSFGTLGCPCSARAMYERTRPRVEEAEQGSTSSPRARRPRGPRGAASRPACRPGAAGTKPPAHSGRPACGAAP